MKYYRADLHIHTVLSPCADIFMGPKKIIEEAVKNKLDIIGITDHNSTANAEVVKMFGFKEGINVLCGAEVTSKEEVHCLTFFENSVQLNEFQEYLENHLPNIKNDVKLFGCQYIIDKNEMIISEYEKLLISGLRVGIHEICQKVHELKGLFIPAHISKKRNGILEQLGFMPSDLDFDALELCSKDEEMEMRKQFDSKTNGFILSSDAHMLHEIGTHATLFYMMDNTFDEIRMALAGLNDRKVIISK